MQIQGTHTFKAPQQVVWDALQDPTLLSMALPGGEQLAKLNENEYKAAMNVRVGPVQGKFEGKIELGDINAPASYRLKVSGQGAPGFVNGEGHVQLEASGADTIMHYTGDVQVGGKIAGVGQRLIDSTAKSIIRQGLAALDVQIQARAVQAAAVAQGATVVPASTPALATERRPAEPETPTVTAVSTPAAVTPPAPLWAPPAGPSAAKLATGVAKDVARDLASDLIPMHQQEKVLWFGLGAMTMLVVVLLLRPLFR